MTRFDMSDTPGLRVYPNTIFAWKVLFKGEIRDKCPMHLNKLMDRQTFSLFLAGQVTEDGKYVKAPTWSGDPPPQWGPTPGERVGDDGEFGGYLPN